MFDVNQGTVRGKVQLKEIKFTKAEKVQVESSGASFNQEVKVQVARYYNLSGQRKCKKGAKLPLQWK